MDLAIAHDTIFDINFMQEAEWPRALFKIVSHGTVFCSESTLSNLAIPNFEIGRGSNLDLSRLIFTFGRQPQNVDKEPRHPARMMLNGELALCLPRVFAEIAQCPS